MLCHDAAFKTWSQDHTDADPALAERALGHAVRGDVQKAYDRAAMVETGAGTAQIVPIHEEAARIS